METPSLIHSLSKERLGRGKREGRFGHPHPGDSSMNTGGYGGYPPKGPLWRRERRDPYMTFSYPAIFQSVEGGFDVEQET